MVIKTYVPYAKHAPSDTLVHVDEVPNGLACECVCVSCGAKLLAKNNGKVKVHHFAHVNSEECPNYAKETLAHVLAKGIFVLTDQLYLPMPNYCYIGNNSMTKYVKDIYVYPFQQDVFAIKSIELEKKDNDTKLVPDISGKILIYDQWVPLWIEVCVHHKCDDEKIRKIKDKNILTIEININTHSLYEHGEKILNCLFDMKTLSYYHRDFSEIKRMGILKSLPVEITTLHLPEYVKQQMLKLKTNNLEKAMLSFQHLSA